MNGPINRMDSGKLSEEGREEYKPDFVAHLSHDIRTPLNAIIGMTAIARSHIMDEQRVAACLAKIDMASRHLMDIIDEAMVFNRIKDGSVDIKPEIINLLAFEKEVFPRLRNAAAAKKQTLTVDAAEVWDVNACADPYVMKQIIVEIVENAIKYTQEGGHISLTFKENRLSRDEAEFIFICEDDGIGMEDEYLENIFEPLLKPEDSRIRSEQGAGFGLAIVEGLLKAMNGSIEVETAPDRGTKVVISLPLERPENADVQDEALRHREILILSDDVRTSQQLADALSDAGLVPRTFRTAEEAAEDILKYRSVGKEYTAVLLSTNLQGGSMEAAKVLRREIGFGLPIILAESYPGEIAEAEARTMGITQRLIRPVFKGALLKVLEELVGTEFEETRENQAAQGDGFFTEEMDFSGKHMLLVEDNELNAELAMEIFETTGAEINWVRNGKEAVDAVMISQEGFYDIIFMDVQMPVMNGYEATIAIRELPRADVALLPIIALTANAFSSDARQARNSGMNEHITKPIEPAKLEIVLKKYLKD